MTDLKTCQDVRWEFFRKSVENYRYDIQNAMYSDGVKNITGKAPEYKCWLTVESEGAHETRIHEVGAEYDAIGHFEYRRSLKKLKEAIDAGKFTQGNDDIIIGEPTSWFKRKYEQLGILDTLGV
jgi:hypothetical protein